MQKSTQNAPSEPSNIQYSLNENNKSTSSEELLKRIEINGTPFHILGNPEMGYGICFGKYRLTELFAIGAYQEEHIKSEAHCFLSENKWTITARLAGVIADITIAENAKNNSTEKPHD